MEEGGIGDGCGDAVVAESVADNYRLAMVPGVLKCRGVLRKCNDVMARVVEDGQ